MEKCLDFLLQCAKSYENLLNYKYHFVIARKGVCREFSIIFQKSDFHHLAGLHKLTDKRSLQHGSREVLFDSILQSKFDMNYLQSSFHFDEMKDRLFALDNLEKLLDSENLVALTPAVKVRHPNHWTARDVPSVPSLFCPTLLLHRSPPVSLLSLSLSHPQPTLHTHTHTTSL